MPIRAVGFDIDGTLYPANALFMRMATEVARSPRLFLAFNATRRDLRRLDAGAVFRSAPPSSVEAFHRHQAALVAARLGRDPAPVYEAIERIYYRRSEERFSRIMTFPRVTETLDALRAAGLRLGALSDFPCERKLELLGLAGRFDAAITSESTGLVKPDRASFDLLAARLGVPNAEMLYVGNSEAYDVRGAAAAGMRTAFISRSARARRRSGADFAFCDWRELAAYVLSVKDS